HILNLDSGKSKKLTVNLRYDNPNRLPYFKDVSTFISRSGAALSPDASRVVFAARGDLFSAPAKKGVTVNLTRTQGVRERFPLWSPDGKWIAYVSDKTGDYEVYIMDPKTKKSTQLTHNHKLWKSGLTWSPDSKMLLLRTQGKGRNVLLLDIKSKTVTVVDKGYLGNIGDFSWSGDSGWITYSKGQTNNLNAIFIYSVAQKKTFQVSSGNYNDQTPVFSLSGKYLFFVSDRDFDVSFGRGVSSMEFDFV
ncbi:MAG: acetyl-CoA synthetase, partial [bacterium]|nr:acetyl-CoA synthetase [bacterium]